MNKGDSNRKDSKDDNRNSIPGRSNIRQTEIQIIKRIPLHALLIERGFKPISQKFNSAVFHDLPNLPGTTEVFYASRSQAWLYKNNKVTRSILDLWQLIYFSHIFPEKDRYPVAIAELRVIAGISNGKPRTGSGEVKDIDAAEPVPQETGDNDRITPTPRPSMFGRSNNPPAETVETETDGEYIHTPCPDCEACGDRPYCRFPSRK